MHHYNILLKNLPSWLKKEISDEKLSICELGCGMGEGVNLLKIYFKSCEVTGVDISDHAVKEAQKRYPDCSFICSDLSEFKYHYDVIVASQTIKQFEDPQKIFTTMANLADKYLILISPFREEKIDKENFYPINYNFFPLKHEHHQLIYFKEIDKNFLEEPVNYGNDEQILLYANKNNPDLGKYSQEVLNNKSFDEFKLLKNDYNRLETLNNEYFSLFLYEKSKLEDLIKKYGMLESNLYHEKKRTKELRDLNRKYASQYSSEKEKIEKLIRENQYLKDLVNAYKKRKIVKVSDSIIMSYRKFKSRFNRSPSAEITSATPEVKKVEDISVPQTKDVLQTKWPKKLKDIKVAVILDEISYNSFKYEFKAIPIGPVNWLEKFKIEKPDLFLCESAWSGIYSKLRPWKDKINYNIKFKGENRQVLLNILKYCNKHGIPTIFWNKEDPTHHNDKFNNFVDTAMKFDHIFTTAEECVKKYKDYGHPSVHLLMFGAQPRIFNPIENQRRSNDFIFAGSWNNHHTDRCKEMAELFDHVLDCGDDLKIYDGAYYTNDPNRVFPDKYLKYVNPLLSFDQISKVYKESNFAININTETKSKTMFSRRVFELMLCNTLVLSNYSKGLSELFGDNIIFFKKDKELDLSNSDVKRINNLYKILKNHTYINRFKQILDDINYEYIEEDNSISIYYTVNQISEIEDILKHYESIVYESKKLVLLISDEIPNHQIKNIYKSYATKEVSVYSLNYLLNQNGVISNNTPYFVFANYDLIPEFIEKGLLHYSYIDRKVGITLGDNFRLTKTKDIENVLFSSENFTRTFDKLFKGNSIEFPVYTVQIPGASKTKSPQLPEKSAEKLVISYCFPPYADSSGNVMAKRVREHGEVVDVIQSDMGEVRDVNKHLDIITEGLIEDKIVIDSDSGDVFGNWDLIYDFCKKGLKKIDENVQRKGEYKEIYSRALLPASHFLAFEAKIRYPNTKWIAEFSDPVLYDDKGDLRYSKINDQKFLNKVNTLLKKQNLPKYKDANLFFLCEYLPYAFADEIVFTNENQKKHMINRFPFREISGIVKKKARVNRHPSLREEFYYLFESDYSIDESYVNIAYFGRDYETRNLNDVFNALNKLNDHHKDLCKIHIFTMNVKQFEKSVENNSIKNNLVVNPYVNFFEFLNLTTKFDCLIINDYSQKHVREINPYLPCKLSDYIVSGTDIWAIHEENSVLSKIDLKYKSISGDLDSTKRILKKIIEDHQN